MQVKRYRAKTVKEAITKIRNTLGPEAMIISTKKLRGSSNDNGFEIEAVQEGNYTADENSNLMGDVKSELMSIKEMIYLLNHSGSVIEKLMMDPGILNLYAKLIRNGVNDHYVKMFMEKAGALNEHSPDSLNDMRRKIIKEIMQVIEIKDPFEARNTKRIIAAFIGTTGVGKTTTIAKLAARLMLMAKKTVALISIDNYRIGAVEQLKTYANILGIPIFPAFNRKDLLFALKRVEGKDFVLVDTAGQSQYDRSRIEELQKMTIDFNEAKKEVNRTLSRQIRYEAWQVSKPELEREIPENGDMFDLDGPEETDPRYLRRLTEEQEMQRRDELLEDYTEAVISQFEEYCGKNEILFEIINK